MYKHMDEVSNIVLGQKNHQVVKFGTVICYTAFLYFHSQCISRGVVIIQREILVLKLLF